MSTRARRLLTAIERQAMRLEPHLPTWAKHPLALGACACARAVQDLHYAVNRLTIPWHEIEQVFVQTARIVDVKVPCPHCGDPATQTEIELLKTYCFMCSDYGMPPEPRTEETTHA